MGETNDEFLDEILHNNNLEMEVAMQFISNDKTVNSTTVKNLKDFNSQSLATPAKKGEQLVSMMPVFEKTFELMGDDIVEVSTENESLKNKLCSYDKNWLDESKAKLMKQIDDEELTNLNKSTMEKQMEKTILDG